MSREAHDLSLYIEGVARFNAGDFYEAHEVWEDLWLRNRSPARPFLQSLIQIAAGYHHREGGRDRPYRALLREARARLQPFAPTFLGLDVASLLLEVERAQAHAGLEGAAPRMRFVPPDLAAFGPHAGSAPGPAAKQDWLWHAKEARND